MNKLPGPIGVFDSGYGGLTILKEIKDRLPQYDYIYLGDNARTPYGTRSFDVVYEYTLQAVKSLFEMGCHLVILACNTASAKALRSIQQRDLPNIDPDLRVLGVIRPSVEVVNEISKTRHVGVLGTVGTIASDSYPIELDKISEKNLLNTSQEACPMWVPLVENHEIESEGAEYFVRKNVDNLLLKDEEMDTIILGCTHYPLLIDQIRKYVPEHIYLLNQGEVIAEKLEDYLRRHPEMEVKCSKGASRHFYTTESVEQFNPRAGFFLEENINAKHIHLK